MPLRVPVTGIGRTSRMKRNMPNPVGERKAQQPAGGASTSGRIAVPGLCTLFTAAPILWMLPLAHSSRKGRIFASMRKR